MFEIDNELLIGPEDEEEELDEWEDNDADSWDEDDEEDYEDEIDDDDSTEGGQKEPVAPPTVEPPPSSEDAGDEKSPPAPPVKTASEIAAEERIAELEKQKREAEAREKQIEIENKLSGLTAEAQRRYQKLLDGGTAQEAAQESAQNWLEKEQVKLQQAVESAQNRERDKELLALRLIRQHPTADFDELMKHDNPDTMKAAATKSATDSKEVQELKARIAKLEGKTKAPVQKVSRSGGSERKAPTSLDKKARRYGSHGGSMTTEEYNKWVEGR